MKKLYEIDNKIKVKNVNDLVETPVVIRVNSFDETSAKEFSEQMSKAHNTGQPFIPIVIDSYGGQVYSLIAMIEEIQSSKLPIATICMGKAMSCGSVLLTCGTEDMRFIAPNSTVMVHDVSSMHGGKNEELKSSAKQTDKLQKQIFHLMAKNCKQNVNYFLDLIHEKSHAEWYLDATEAKKHNMVNHIRVPSMTVKVGLDITLD